MSPPEVLPAERIVGEPLTLECAVLGFPVGKPVEFRIFEPFNLHGDPIATVSGETGEEDRIVTVEWTYDHAEHKDTISSTRFVVIAGCGDSFNISEPIEILERFERTLAGAGGEPLPETDVLLRAPGRTDIEARSDADGKLELLLPPAKYLVEVLDEDDE
ncbi:MAG: hypothetical protein JKY65_11705 [Planctomycetes bacterium]|nr:hypothetical protein [Planctomycetota bacterium]